AAGLHAGPGTDVPVDLRPLGSVAGQPVRIPAYRGAVHHRRGPSGSGRGRVPAGAARLGPAAPDRPVGGRGRGLIRGDPVIQLTCQPGRWASRGPHSLRSEEHTSELQSRENLVCRLLLEKKKKKTEKNTTAIQSRKKPVSGLMRVISHIE